LRETAAGFGEQRIYASHKSIMFSRASCYVFVRPKRQALEVCVFLGRPLKAPQVRRVHQASKTKVAHIVHITHRDEVEPPLTDWLEEAYQFAGAWGTRSAGGKGKTKTKAKAKAKAKTKIKAKAKAGAQAKAKTKTTTNVKRVKKR
jgi:hypothetical protein